MSGPVCAECGSTVSDPRSVRCGPCGQRERNRRPRGVPAACAGRGMALHDGRSLRCNTCEQVARRQSRAEDGRVLNELLVCPLRDEGLALVPCQSCGCPIEPRPIGPLEFARIAERGGVPLELCGSCSWLIAGGCR
jgi:hypothetical protein